MTRIFLILVILVSIIACKNSTKETTELEAETVEISARVSPEALAEAQEKDMNILIDDPENQGDKMLLGNINKKGLENEELFPWMKEEFNSYAVSSKMVDSIATQLKDVSIKVFMGTWCEDSQRETPRLFKILEAAEYDLSKIELVAVSHDKDTPSGLEKGLDIEYVPTFIFYKDGEELGRFVEYAQETLEQDILKIVSGVPYKHAYQE